MKKEFSKYAKYINYSDGTIYYGNFIQDNEKYIPTETGLYYDSATKVFTMYENPEVKNGLFLKKSNNHDTIGHSTCFNDIGDALDGPCLDFKKDSIVRFSNNKKGVIVDVVIDVLEDGSYTIYQYNQKGTPTGKVISFSQGRLYFENRLQDILSPTKPHNFIDVGWAYKASYCNMYLSAFDDNLHIRPAWGFYEKSTNRIEFGGFAQTNSSNDEYKYYENGTVTFEAKRCGYGSITNKERHYFGEFKDNSLTGIACIRYQNGSTYAGVVYNGYPSSLGIKWDKKKIEFGEFIENGRRDALFTIENNYLKISVYKKDKKIGTEYRINLDTFDVYEYPENRTIYSEIYRFNDMREIEDLSIEQKIDDMYKNKLKEAGFDSEVVEDEYTHDPLLFVSKFNYQNVNKVSVPSIADGIKDRTFKGCNNVNEIQLEDGVKYLDEYCFYDCKNLSIIKFGKGITTVNAFMANSLKIKELSFPNNVTCIKQNAFINCKNLRKVTVSQNCVIEPDAFPKNCEIIRENKGLVKNINQPKSMFTSIFENPKGKSKVKKNGSISKINFKSIFSSVGEFFHNIKDKLIDLFENFSDWIKDALGTVGDAIVNFFCWIGGIFVTIGEFIWNGLKFIGKGILVVILAPVKLVASFFDSDNLLLFIPVIVVGVLDILWLVGVMEVVTTFSISVGGSYSYDLTTSMLDWVKTWPGLLQIIGYILLAIVAIFDFVVVLLLFKIILPFIFMILFEIIKSLLIFLLPLAAVVYLFAVLIRNESFSRNVTITCLLLTIVGSIYYYIQLFALI